MLNSPPNIIDPHHTRRVCVCIVCVHIVFVHCVCVCVCACFVEYADLSTITVSDACNNRGDLVFPRPYYTRNVPQLCVEAIAFEEDRLCK